MVKITEFAVPDYFDNYQNLISATINVFYEALGEQTRTRLRLSQDLVATLSKINQIASPQVRELEDLEQALAWMHKHTLIRLADGSNLFHQSMKIRVTKGVREDRVTREYPKTVKPHYEEQARRTHIMLDYGEHHNQPEFNHQEYIENYFFLPKSEFSIQHPNTDGEAPNHPSYQGIYRGSLLQRDGAYHQGTVWEWLLGPFAIAHLRVYNNPAQAREFLEPMMNHLIDYGVGSLGEICDGDAPMQPRGCIVQAWTVAEILRAWIATEPV